MRNLKKSSKSNALSRLFIYLSDLQNSFKTVPKGSAQKDPAHSLGHRKISLKTKRKPTNTAKIKSQKMIKQNTTEADRIRKLESDHRKFPRKQN